MNNYKGYVLRAVKTNRIFPLKYIDAKKYNSTPNQREEIKAIRDENTRDLVRVTAEGTKTSISMSTVPVDLEQKIEIQKFFTDAEELQTDAATSKQQRKVLLEYWNDEDNDYHTAYFYRPDIQFVMSRITASTIKYEPFDISLVEY